MERQQDWMESTQIFKYGGETVIELMHTISGLAWKEEKISKVCTKMMIILVHKGKSSRSEYREL